MFENEKQFKNTLLKCTENYGFLVLDLTTRSNKIEDQVFYYKVPNHKFNVDRMIAFIHKLYENNM